jgi:radical SAM/Cys-rich protein
MSIRVIDARPGRLEGAARARGRAAWRQCAREVTIARVQSPDFAAAVEGAGLPRLRRAAVDTLQVNLTRRCNLACHHCHVESSPVRSESMDDATVERVLALLEASPGVEWLDLTGGAPELHPRFRSIVQRARALGRRVIDRCNLTVFFEPGCGDLPEFLAQQAVRVVASLPCYSRENVDRQRGRGVFEGSIEALRRLNALGYGKPGSPLQLDLVFNPQGVALPGPQAALEADYRRELRSHFGIEFHRLLALANMPIARFARELERAGRTAEYLSLLVSHFNPETVAHVMCRSLVSVDHTGQLFDCDFNQALEIPLGGGRRSVWDVEKLEALAGRPIATAAHCFGCTAGAGSSCGGALVGSAG